MMAGYYETYRNSFGGDTNAALDSLYLKWHSMAILTPDEKIGQMDLQTEIQKRRDPTIANFAKGVIGIEPFPNFAKFATAGSTVDMAQQASAAAIIGAPAVIGAALTDTAGTAGGILGSFGSGLGITSFGVSGVILGIAAIAAAAFFFTKK
jgi:hypothetical protein